MATKLMVLPLLLLLSSQRPPPLTFNLDKQSIEGLHQAMELALAPRLTAVLRAKWTLVHAAGQADDRQAGSIPAAKATSVMHFHDVVEEELSVHHFG